MAISPVISEYEVFKNTRNALAFFFNRHPLLDQNDGVGPFWFALHDNTIVAGTENAHTIFEDVSDDLINTARERGVIMLVEFEDKKPYRCTPCYLSENL